MVRKIVKLENFMLVVWIGEAWSHFQRKFPLISFQLRSKLPNFIFFGERFSNSWIFQTLPTSYVGDVLATYSNLIGVLLRNTSPTRESLIMMISSFSRKNFDLRGLFKIVWTRSVPDEFKFWDHMRNFWLSLSGLILRTSLHDEKLINNRLFQLFKVT